MMKNAKTFKNVSDFEGILQFKAPDEYNYRFIKSGESSGKEKRYDIFIERKRGGAWVFEGAMVSKNKLPSKLYAEWKGVE